MDRLLHDLRYASRTLAKNPGFTAVAVLTLALGIGANTAIFSLIDAVLLRSLPVKEPEELVIVSAFHGSQGRDFSYPIFREMQTRQEVFSDLFATGSVGFLRVSAEGLGELDATQIEGRFVSTNYFTALGVQPALGRIFTEDEAQVVVISHQFWRRQFGRDQGVLGRTISLNSTAFAIIGVAPPEFFGASVGLRPDIWVPIEAQPLLSSRNMLEAHTATWFRTMARLQEGVTQPQAEAALTGLYRRLIEEETARGLGSRIHAPPRPEEMRIEVEPGHRGLGHLRMRFSKPLQLLMGVVGLVLLIACCNVANLLLARGAARQKEIGIRLAIGVSRARVIRQLLTENLLLAVLGGAAGLVLAFQATGFLSSFVAIRLDLQPDWHILGFTAALSLLTGLLFGLVPAWQSSSLDINSALKESGRRNVSGRPRQRLSRTLVVSQVALSFVLLVGVGLLARTLQNFQHLDAGFDRNNVLLVDVRPDSSAIKTEELPAVADQVLRRLNALPGVQAASLSAMPPMTGGSWTAPVRVPQSSVDPAGDAEVRKNLVSARYFETIGMPVLRGRNFAAEDSAGSPKVMVVNETMARHYFGNQDALGKLVYFPKVDSQGRYVPFEESMDRDQAAEIIGVVQDAKYNDLRQETPRMAYFAWVQESGFLSSIEVRTHGDPLSLAAPVREAIREVSPHLVVRNVQSLAERVNQTLWEERLMRKLLSLFGGLAVVLACVGLYGVMAYSVARRTREIGIRMAVGARPHEMAGSVLRESLLLAALGLTVGIPVALLSTRLIERLLFGVIPTDAATLAVAALLMLLFVGAAGYLPARRAAKVDPMTALRNE